MVKQTDHRSSRTENMCYGRPENKKSYYKDRKCEIIHIHIEYKPTIHKKDDIKALKES